MYSHAMVDRLNSEMMIMMMMENGRDAANGFGSAAVRDHDS